MSDRDAHERILASLHEVALGHTPWSRASALIDQTLGLHGGTLACGDEESEEDFRLHFLVSTIRSRVKSACAEPGLTRQVELVRLVQLLAGALVVRR